MCICVHVQCAILCVREYGCVYAGVHITITAWFLKEHHKFLLGTQSHASRFGQFFGYNKIQNRIGHWIKIRLCEMQKSKHNLNHHLFHPKCSFFSFLDVNVEPHNLLSLHCKMLVLKRAPTHKNVVLMWHFQCSWAPKKHLCAQLHIGSSKKGKTKQNMLSNILLNTLSLCVFVLVSLLKWP